MKRKAYLLTTALVVAWGLVASAEAQRAPARSRSSSSARTAPAPVSRTPSPSVSSGGGGYRGSSYGYGTRGYDPFYPGRSRVWQPPNVRGRVLLPGGSPSAEPPRIYASCPGATFPLTYCDLNGRFSIGWSEFSRLGFRRVGWGYGSRFTNLGGCGLTAFLPGYSSPLVTLDSWTGMSAPSVGKMSLRRQPGVEGHTVSFTTLAAPKAAKKAYKNGLKHFRNDRLKKALAEFEKAVEEYPDYAAAWAMLAEVRDALGYESGMREALERALEIDPKYLKPNILMARLEVKDEDWPRVIELTDSVLRLNPNLTEMRHFQAMAYYKTGQYDEALRAARLGLVDRRAAEYPQPQLRAIIGSVHANNNDYERAATYYRQVVAHWPNSGLARSLKVRLEQWRALGRISGPPRTVAYEQSVLPNGAP